MDRRAKVLRKLTGKLGGGDDNTKLRVSQLMQALEVTMYCTIPRPGEYHKEDFKIIGEKRGGGYNFFEKCIPLLQSPKIDRK